MAPWHSMVNEKSDRKPRVLKTPNPSWWEIPENFQENPGWWNIIPFGQKDVMLTTCLPLGWWVFRCLFNNRKTKESKGHGFFINLVYSGLIFLLFFFIWGKYIYKPVGLENPKNYQPTRCIFRGFFGRCLDCYLDVPVWRKCVRDQRFSDQCGEKNSNIPQVFHR